MNTLNRKSEQLLIWRRHFDANIDPCASIGPLISHFVILAQAGIQKLALSV